jgi:kinetochore protein Spc7/SPC105
MEPDSRKPGRPKGRQSLAHPQNATADIAALQRAHDAQAAKKKSRGKSLGPGGLEALTETSGNAIKIAQAQVRSILKPTVPLTPPKNIPSFDELRRRSTSKRSPAKASEDLLIDFSTPGPGRSSEVPMTGADNVLDPFSPIRQQASDKTTTVEENEEAERKRKADKQAILEQRAARRKSMANRRVSFAPEATLHTWSVMDMGEDSTSSSASNSTRRQSSMTAQQSPGAGSSPPKAASIDRPKTPEEQTEQAQVPASPAYQRDLHQKKRRRSSTGSQSQLEGALDDSFSSSPSGDIVESSPVRIDDGVDSDSDTDGDTAMSMDDTTSHSIQSSGSEGSTQTSLDERLRQAANQAGTRGIDYDEHGDDVSMEMATATITQAFQPWANKSQETADDSAMYDQENINPFSPASKARQVQPEQEDDTQDMSMDVTHAVGGIIQNESSSPGKGRRKSVPNRRMSSAARRRSSGGESTMGDETMDFTTVEGGILSKGEPEATEETSDEDMAMEFTTAVGGVVGRNRRESAQSVQTADNETMDMTAAVGTILPPIEEQTEPLTADNTRTAAMEMTKAMGGILGANATPLQKTLAKHLMQEETDAGQLSLSPSSRIDNKPSATPAASTQGFVTSIASETGSPDIALKPRLSGRSRQSAATSTTPKFSPKRSVISKSPMKSAQQMTPTKQLTPLPTRPESPNRTPIAANVTHRGASPKKLFKEEIKARQSPASTQKTQPLFSKDEHTGRHTPSVVLQATRPKPRRRSSGVGIDQDGFGSPRVSEMLDRRESIGDSAAAFKLGSQPKSKLRFEDPRQIEQELDAERAEEERRESGRFIMEQEANEQQEENATLQLKEMIDSMSPKKAKSSKLKGRKSLAPGGAKGLLGKRPAELDLDEDDDAEGTPKRLKAVGRDGSPVKKVHLPKPPSKEETTGRLTRAQQQQLSTMSLQGGQTPAITASPGTTTAASPHVVGRYRDIPADDSNNRPESFEAKLDNVIGAIDVSTVVMESQDDARISLQKFLNMTNIHFIELSTTKRRQTVAPTQFKRPSEEARDSSTESVFAAAATTIPVLDLYQHATRELKSYIATGRKIIRSIEAETLAEQPPLFREYVDARPDVKQIMDNQFRNGKTNARLQSKEGWYTWRTQLIDGLKSGLEGINKGMQADLSLLDSQNQSLDAVVPSLNAQHQALESELKSASEALEELDSVDTAALEQSRQDLHAADELFKSKASLLESLRQQMSDKSTTLEAAEELKTEMSDQIAEADRIRQQYRGWPVEDVLTLKSSVDEIEKSIGWRLESAEENEDDDQSFGVALTLIYRGALRLFFYPTLYKADTSRRRSGRHSRSVSGPNAPISLAYAPVNEDEGMSSPSSDISTEQRFILQLIRSQLQAYSMMPKGSVSAKTVLSTIANAWDVAAKIGEEVRLLGLVGITAVDIVSDEKVSVKTKLVGGGSRIDVEFVIAVALLNDGEISSSTSVSATCVYGEHLGLVSGKLRKVQAALGKEVEDKGIGNGAFVGAVMAFERWLEGQKESKAVSEPESKPVVVSEQVKRSPLAVKKTSVVQKRLPVPKKSMLSAVAKDVGAAVMAVDKENVPPSKMKGLEDDGVAVVGEVLTPVKPAIPPEIQDEMLRYGSPIKRVGALRRSPI